MSLFGGIGAGQRPNLPAAGNIQSRVQRAQKPREITSTFLITLNTNKQRSIVNENILDALVQDAFSQTEIVNMIDSDVFMSPPGFDYDELMSKYDGLAIPRDDADWQAKLLEYVELDAQYQHEVGGKFKRLHTHIVARFKTKVPFHIKSDNLKAHLNQLVANLFGPQFGLNRGEAMKFIKYCNVKWLTDNAEKRRIYITKSLRDDKKGEDEKEAADIENLFGQLQI